MSPILYTERAGGGSSGVSSPSGAVPALVWHGVTLCYRFCSLMALACGPPSACDLLVQNVLQDGLTLIQEVIRGDDRAAEKGSSS
ncbi:Protein Niban 2 [Manis pentadactyla]|nr:Protein Niban 2 [Manis pentadactyla]